MATDIQDSTEGQKKLPVSSGMRQLLDFNAKLRASIRELEAEQQLQIAAFEKELEDARLSYQADLERKQEATIEQLASVREGEERLRAELRGEQEKTSQTVLALESVQSNLASAEEKIKSLQAELQSLQVLDQENKQLKAQLAKVHSDLEEEKRAKETALSQCDALRQEGTLERCRLLEAENDRMKAQVERRETEISAALKSKEQAEQVAFESRNKLLTLYSEQESGEILKAKLEKVESELETQTQEKLKLQAALKEAEFQRAEMEEKILYSSKRDNLRDSLSTMAQRRKSGDPQAANDDKSET